MRNYSNFQKFYFAQLLLVLILGGYLYVFGSWQVQTNILSILPNAQVSKALLESEQALFGQAKKKVTIAVTGEQAVTAYHVLVEKLKGIEYVDIDTQQIPTIEDIAQFYSSYKDNFLSGQYRESLNNSQALQDLILSQMTQMANPFVAQTLAISPRLALADHLNHEFNNLTHYKQNNGLVSAELNDQTYYLLSLNLSIDAFSIKESQLIANQLQGVFSSIEDEFDIQLIYSGVLFHTAYSSELAETEISTFGLISLLGIILLIVFVFRSITPLFTALGIISLAVIYGGIGLMLFFNDIHLLSFVFAVTLIGIVIDYCFHAFVHTTGKDKTKGLITPLLLGFVTTALGYLVIASSPLALLTQVAVFMIFGLFGALISVIALLPKLKQLNTFQIQSSVFKVADKFKVRVNGFIKYRWYVLSILLLLTSSTLILNKIKFNDDIRLLNSSPTWLMAHEKRISELSDMQSTNRIMVYSKTVEGLLQKQEQAISQLKSVQSNLSFKGLFGLLPSKKQQQADYDLIQTAHNNQAFDLGLNQLGLADPVNRFNALDYDAFIKGPLAQIVQIYIVKHDLGYALWFSVKGQLNNENVKWLSEQKDLLLHDTAKNVSNALSQYRVALIYLLMLACLVISLVLIMRYGIKQGLLSALVIGLSTLSAALITNFINDYLNIFNLLGILLILALAIDYVIFYQEQGIKTATLLAISLSALSSILAFGMLAFSQTPAVQSFGLIVMFGITFTFIIAPLSASSSHHKQNNNEGKLNDT